MTRNAWEKRIIKACKEAGTYQKCFDDPIKTLAWILEQRDALIKQFEDSGGQVVVEHVNVKNQTNLEQNPCVRLINDFNRDALTYWRDLGLTPKGLKAISDTIIKDESSDVLNFLVKEARR